jgi:anthranilate phosphoribosyltransferase
MFHPAMKAVGPIRRELGIKTFFNMLGPMVNPSSPQNQLIGVFDLELARLYQYIYQQTDTRFSIVHSLDGYDEVSLTAPFKVIYPEGEQLLTAEDLNLPMNTPDSIAGGSTVEDSANIFKTVLQGKGTPSQNNAVIANATLAIHTINPASSMDDCQEQASVSLMEGKAGRTLSTLLDMQS